MRNHINHITKIEFLMAFHAAHNNSITNSNILGGFRGSGLVPFDPQAIISKIDVKLWTPTPTGPPLPEADPWVSQTPHTTAEALSQSAYVQKRITDHKGSSPTKIFSAATQLAKDAEEGLELEVDLENLEVRRSNGRGSFKFEVEPFKRYCLLNGLDDIGLTLQKADKIDKFETRRSESWPWLDGFGYAKGGGKIDTKPVRQKKPMDW